MFLQHKNPPFTRPDPIEGRLAVALLERSDFTPAASALPVRTAPSLTRGLVLAAAMFLTVLTIQMALGPYSAERGNYSDEAVHFMNGMLVRDYVWAGAPESPMPFAQRYYVNYPKIAPLMWPPLFHMVLGLAMIIVPSPHLVGLLLMAFVTAWTAWRLFLIVEKAVSTPLAAVAVVLFLSTSVVLNLTTVIMLDMAVAALTLEATYWFARFAGQPKLRHAVMFAVMAAGACLTKGNGLAIVLVPLVFMCVAGRFDLLRSRGLWTAALIVAALAGPLLAYSLTLDAGIGDFAAVSWSGMLAKAMLCTSFLLAEVGRPVVCLVVVVTAVLAWTARRPTRLDEAGQLSAAMAALAISAVLIHVITPLRWVDSRYMAMAMAPLWALVICGFSQLAPRPHVAWVRWVWAGAVVLAVASFLNTRPAVVTRLPLGFREVTAWLGDQNRLSARRIFVASDELGEGALISEVASMEPTPSATVIRGSKLLASDGWSDNDVDLVFSSSDGILKELHDLGVSDIVVDETANGLVPAQVRRLVESHPDEFRQVLTTHGTRHIVVYEPTTLADGPRKPLRVTPSPTLETLSAD